jgi:hypothetical protein
VPTAARFTWLAHAELHDFAAGPSERLHFQPWSRISTLEALRTVRRLRELTVDLFVDARHDVLSRALCRLLGVRHSLALEPALALDGEISVDTGLCRALGINRSVSIPSMSLPAAARAAVDQFLTWTHLTCGFIAAHAGETVSALCSPRDYGIIMRRLGRAWRVPSLVLYHGRAQRRWAEAAVARSGGHALLAPEWPWPQMGAAIDRAELFLGHDPRVTTLAGLTQTPVLDVAARRSVDEILAHCEHLLENRPVAVNLARAA